MFSCAAVSPPNRTRRGVPLGREFIMDMSNVALIVEAIVILGAVAAIGRSVLKRVSSRTGAAAAQQGASNDRGEAGRSAAKYHPVHVAIHWFIAFAMANLLLRGAFIMV